jgi:hypothetical protein
MSNVGTIRKVVIDGVTYDVFNDVDITFNKSKYTIESMATTGRTLHKRTKRVQTIEGLVLATTPAEMVALANKADALADKTFSIELADGSVFKATGQINFENYTSADGKSNIQLIPTRDWTEFLA